MDDTERSVQGMTVRREVLGDTHVDRAVAATTPFTADFQSFITRYAWGDIWSRPGLSRAERSMITLTALAVLRQEEELAMHLRAALRNGLSPDQIKEVLLQVAVYAGVPAANRAFAVAARVLAEAGLAGWAQATRPHRQDSASWAHRRLSSVGVAGCARVSVSRTVVLIAVK